MYESDQERLLKAIGKELKRRRERKGFTQEATAEKISAVMERSQPYTLSTVQKIDTGRMTLKGSLRVLEAYAQVVDADFNSILFMAEKAAVLPLDLDGDEAVGITDFLLLLGNWG